MPWLKVVTILYVAAMTAGFAYAGYRALLNLRELYRREGYEQGARDTLETDVAERSRKLDTRRKVLGR